MLCQSVLTENLCHSHSPQHQPGLGRVLDVPQSLSLVPDLASLCIFSNRDSVPVFAQGQRASHCQSRGGTRLQGKPHIGACWPPLTESYTSLPCLWGSGSFQSLPCWRVCLSDLCLTNPVGLLFTDSTTGCLPSDLASEATLLRLGNICNGRWLWGQPSFGEGMSRRLAMDSDLDAFSRYPSLGSLGPTDTCLSTETREVV
jgi:hypothetical protein